MKNTCITLLLALLVGCVNNDLQQPFDCTSVTISVTLEAQSNVSSCAASDGSLTISANGGEGPYLFSIDGGDFTAGAVFSNLSTGSHTVVAKDAKGCVGTLLPSPTITSPGSTLLLTVDTFSDTNCLTNNGSLSASASGGVPPYTFKLGNGVFSSTTTYANLAPNNYSITVQDSQGCTFTVNKTVSQGDTGISWSGEINSIISTNCAVSGCHNGSQSPNLSTLSNVQNQKAGVKSRTSSKSMPPSGRPALTEEQIKKIACWVDDGAKNN